MTKAFLTVEEKNANELNRSSRAGIEKNENEEEKHTHTNVDFQSDFFLRISTERERERKDIFVIRKSPGTILFHKGTRQKRRKQTGCYNENIC